MNRLKNSSNPTDEMRIGSISVTTEFGDNDTIYIYQDGATPRIEPSQTYIQAPASGEEETVSMSSNVSWRVYHDSDWIDLPFASGIGNDDLIINVAENDTGIARTAELTIAGGDITKTIYVQQTAQGTPAPSTPATIEFASAPDQVQIPTTGSATATVSAIIKDQYGNVMTGIAPTYSVTNAQNVQINSSTGVLTVSSTAAPGSITVTAGYNGLTSVSTTIQLTGNTQPVAYILYFGESEYEVDVYVHYDITVTAYARTSTRQAVTAPELVGITYTSESGATSTTGYFTFEELEIDAGMETWVTAIATFSNGTTAQATCYIVAPFIHPR